MWRIRCRDQRGRTVYITVAPHRGAVVIGVYGQRFVLDEASALRLLSAVGEGYYRMVNGGDWPGPERPTG